MPARARQFMLSSMISRCLAILAAGLLLSVSAGALAADQTARPNILWLTTEDIGPHLGCYGVDYADTPRLDRLAAEGVLYENAFATSGVCAPARSCLITGVYPSSLGSHHMRCRGDLPEWFRFFPSYLREAGYYCTNNRKTDYNLPTPRGTWDESSGGAHYKNRKEGQPFFAIFNFTGTHESRLFGSHKPDHDPDDAPVPPYHPDHPTVRKDWARYHDTISHCDAWVAKQLDELEKAGLADETIVFFYGDHGSGMSRGKRWLYDSGLRVPLIVHFPRKFRHLAPGEPGTRTDRLVSFVDFGATVLSLAGVKPPEHMHAEPFLGQFEQKPRDYIYGIRGRIDERYDMVRAVGDGRYKYIRNYFPHKSRSLHIAYSYGVPTMRLWRDLHEQGKLNPVQDRFFKPTRAVEELYDTQSDPHEVNNLADSPDHQDVLRRLREQHVQWVLRTRDVGLLPEPEIKARPRRDGFDNAWEWARSEHYPIEKILAAALRVGQGVEARDQMVADLSSDDPAIRFWAVIGLHSLGQQAQPAADMLLERLDDPDPSVAIEAAELLAKLDHQQEALPVLGEHLLSRNQYVALRAANAIDHLDEKAAPLWGTVEPLSKRRPPKYVRRVVEQIIAERAGK